MAQELKFYNTLTRNKDTFKPLKEGYVGIYVCGMTVYDEPHLGHARAYTAFDVIVRFLKYLGYKVKYIRNITDIDDKIIRRAAEEIPGYKEDPKAACVELTKKYTAAFHEDMKALNLVSPTIEPRATEHIPEIIKIIETLISKGLAYESDGSVYFKVSAFKPYGRLSGRNVEDMETISRVDQDRHKGNALDFALWKSHVEGEPCWESPFGKGRPGWHIECSAMSMKYLGSTFDIHGGGQDLIFPHHENEMAQSCGCTEQEFARYWIHNGFITINKEKMSKSLKNFKTVRDLFKRFRPTAIKYYLLSTHYRSPLDFSDSLIAGAEEGLLKIENALSGASMILSKSGLTLPDSKSGVIPADFIEAMCDDFNTPRALGEIFGVCSELNKTLSAVLPDTKMISSHTASLLAMLELLGIDPQKEKTHRVPKTQWKEAASEILALIQNPDHSLNDSEIDALVSARGFAKTNGNYALADKIRQYLLKKGVELRDQGDGCVWK